MAEIAFLFDEHIPGAVARALRRRGIDVATPHEAGLRGAPDQDLLARAYAEGRVLVTHYDDFLSLHRSQRPHAGIAYCRPRTRTSGQLVERLILIYDVLEPDDIAGRVEFL